MKVSKKNFWFALFFGLILGTTFITSAFSEPTSLPSSTTSYPPVNLGSETQIKEGSLGLGDGTAVASSTLTGANSLYVTGNLAADAVNVRKNATLVGNVNVGGRSIIAGALRAGQVIVSNSTNSVPAYNNTGEKLFFPNGTTTNLIRGNHCTFSNNTACPPGTVLATYNTNGTGTCRLINPVSGTPSSIGACSTSGYPSISLGLTNTINNQGACKATRYYAATGTGTVYWQLKGVSDTEWTSFGSGTTSQVVVGMNGTSAKLYDLRATIVNNGLSKSQTIEVYNVVDTTCASQSGGTGAGATGQ